MGFGNGAFQAARIAIDGVTLVENLYNGKIQTNNTSGNFSPVIISPTVGKAWGFACYWDVSNPVSSIYASVNWDNPNTAISFIDAVKTTATGASLDGTVSDNSNSVTLSTSITNDIVIVMVTSYASPTISDSAGLTWTQRAQQSQGDLIVTMFYAIATSILSGDVISISTPGSAITFIEAFAVTKVDTSNPFDVTNTLINQNTSKVQNFSTGAISTTNSNDFIIAYFTGGYTTQYGGSNNFSIIGSTVSSAEANTWTALQTFSVSTSPTITLNDTSSTSRNNYINFERNGTVVYEIIDNGGAANSALSFYPAQNKSISFLDNGFDAVLNINSASENGSYSAKYISTFNNTLDDGSGNVTFAGHLNLTAGTDKTVGQATLSAGTVTVDNTSVTASSLIFLTNAGASGTVGTLSVGTITAGTSFVINSSSSTDTSKVNWLIVN